jgi:hypothetical protein
MTDLSHTELLRAIADHKLSFVPFGHGLDTHRLFEILLMGDILVTHRSGISSLDDSDNQIRDLNGSVFQWFQRVLGIILECLLIIGWHVLENPAQC